MKGIPAYSLLVKVYIRGVFQFGVLMANLRFLGPQFLPPLFEGEKNRFLGLDQGEDAIKVGMRKNPWRT